MRPGDLTQRGQRLQLSSPTPTSASPQSIPKESSIFLLNIHSGQRILIPPGLNDKHIPFSEFGLTLGHDRRWDPLTQFG